MKHFPWGSQTKFRLIKNFKVVAPAGKYGFLRVYIKKGVEIKLWRNAN